MPATLASCEFNWNQGICMTPLHPVPLVPGRVETNRFYIIFAQSIVNSELCAIGHPPQIISFS